MIKVAPSRVSIKQIHLYIIMYKTRNNWHFCRPPIRSAAAPVSKPPTISTTRTSEFAKTLAIDNRRDNVSTLKNLINVG